MRELLLQAVGVEAYKRHRKRHPDARILSHIYAGSLQFILPAEDRMACHVEEQTDRIDFIPGLVEQSQLLSRLVSEIIRPQYWRNAQLIDFASCALVFGVGIAAMAINLDIKEVLATATLTKVLANGVVNKFYTPSLNRLSAR